jgi:hypothetical protein
MNGKCLLAIALALSLFGLTASATNLGRYVGWTIAADKTIAGYVDEKGIEKSQFDGCNFNWKIIFDDRTVLTCTGYSYHYAYRPEAILLVRNNSWIMLVDGDAYDMRN